MIIEPTGDRVAIIPIDAPEEQGGIIIPEAAKDISNSGIILCCGPLVRGIFAGDKVIFAKYAGNSIMVDGKNILVLHESDIIVVIERAHQEGMIPTLEESPGIGGV